MTRRRRLFPGKLSPRIPRSHAGAASVLHSQKPAVPSREAAGCRQEEWEKVGEARKETNRGQNSHQPFLSSASSFCLSRPFYSLWTRNKGGMKYKLLVGGHSNSHFHANSISLGQVHSLSPPHTLSLHEHLPQGHSPRKPKCQPSALAAALGDRVISCFTRFLCLCCRWGELHSLGLASQQAWIQIPPSHSSAMCP